VPKQVCTFDLHTPTEGSCRQQRAACIKKKGGKNCVSGLQNYYSALLKAASVHYVEVVKEMMPRNETVHNFVIALMQQAPASAQGELTLVSNYLKLMMDRHARLHNGSGR
jgi:major membrane immunogen (membrane-anchored lipoprotein)